MRKLSRIIGVSRCVMNRIGNQFSVRDTVASQFIRHDLPRFITMRIQQSFEKTFGGLAVASPLQEDVDDFSVLIDGSPQVVLLTINLHEYFIDIEGVTETLVSAFQTSSISRPKFVTPQPDGFVADDNASLSQEIFDIPIAEIESMIEPNCILKDFRWESDG